MLWEVLECAGKNLNVLESSKNFGSLKVAFKIQKNEKKNRMQIKLRMI